MVYFDQILEGSNKQDRGAVGAMLETCLFHLKDELPCLKTVILQNDNSGCYQSTKLALLLGNLNGNTPVKVERFIHTKTQDGKGLIDAYFARCTHHLDCFMRTSCRNRLQRLQQPKD